MAHEALELDVTPATEAEEQAAREFIADLVEEGRQDEAAEEPSALTFEQLEELEEIESKGLKFDWPDLKGAWVRIAHMSNIAEKVAKFEAAYRKATKLKANDDGSPGEIPPKHHEQLYRRAMFGTVVKDFCLPLGNGDSIPFDENGFARAMKIRRFRQFVFKHAKELDARRRKSVENDRGN